MIAKTKKNEVSEIEKSNFKFKPNSLKLRNKNKTKQKIANKFVNILIFKHFIHSIKKNIRT